MNKLDKLVTFALLAAGNHRTARASRAGMCAGMCAWGRRTTGMFALLAAGIAAFAADA